MRTIDTLMEDGWEVRHKEYEGKNLWILCKESDNDSGMILYDPVSDQTKLPLLKADFRVDFTFRDNVTNKLRKDVERLVMYKDRDRDIEVKRETGNCLIDTRFPWAPKEIGDLTFDKTMQAFYDRGNKVKGVWPRVIEGTDIGITLSVTGIEYGHFMDVVIDKKEPKSITLDDYVKLGMPDVVEG